MHAWHLSGYRRIRLGVRTVRLLINFGCDSGQPGSDRSPQNDQLLPLRYRWSPFSPCHLERLDGNDRSP
jgi:hypothetical protein